MGYTRLPGGYVTNEFQIIPLSCFTEGLRQINIITIRDIRIPLDSPTFQIKEWSQLREIRSYIEQFKPLCGENYDQNIWHT